jgi:hypothetical protein
MPVPRQPKIYHITHINNLASIVDNVLWSDAERIRQGLNCELIGMTEIKRRRLEELDVDCHPGTKVGQYVPFYFCARSIMLYLLHAGNHPDLSYRGGQRPILHLESDLKTVVKWATTAGRRWAFSTGNAGARYARFLKDLGQLEKLNWEAITANKWRDPDLKEGKQAEFLIERCFPWECIDTIGVINTEMAQQVTDVIGSANHRPPVLVRRHWYYN